MKITDISGTITLADGTTSDFTIGTDGQWQQWGAVTTERLGQTVNAMEAITAALFDDGLLASDDDDSDDDDSDSTE